MSKLPLSNAAIVNNLKPGKLASCNSKGLFSGYWQGLVRRGFGMQNVSAWRKFDLETTLGVDSEPRYLFPFRCQDGKRCLIGSVRAFLTISDHRTHRTYQHLSFDAGMDRNLGRAGDNKQKGKNKKGPSHDGQFGIDFYGLGKYGSGNREV
jgi:hypothetical protein